MTISILLEAALGYAKQGLPVFPCNELRPPLIKDNLVRAT
jgi:hypothetical protein